MKTREEIYQKLSKNNDRERINSATLVFDEKKQQIVAKTERNWMSQEEAVIELLLDIRDLLTPPSPEDKEIK